MLTAGRKSPPGDATPTPEFPPRPAPEAGAPPPPHPSDRLWRDQITEEDWRVHALCGALLLLLFVARAAGWL